MKTETKTLKLTPREYESMQAGRLGAVLRAVLRVMGDCPAPFAVGDEVKLYRPLRDAADTLCYFGVILGEVKITDVRAVRVSELMIRDFIDAGYDYNYESAAIWNTENPDAPFESSWAFMIEFRRTEG